MYTITEFRQNIRKAFNDADSGHEVVIERYGQKFQLVSLVDKPLPGHAKESNPGGVENGFAFKEPAAVGRSYPIPTIKAEDKLPITRITPTKIDNGLCKIHGLPLDDRGRCMQKGCKYA